MSTPVIQPQGLELNPNINGWRQGHYDAHHGCSYGNRESNPYLDDRHMDGVHRGCDHNKAHAYSDGYLAGWNTGLDEWDEYWS